MPATTDRFRKTAEFTSADGTHSFRAGRNLDALTWDSRAYARNDLGRWVIIKTMGYDGFECQRDAEFAAETDRAYYDKVQKS